jgi:hypothetical protein
MPASPQGEFRHSQITEVSLSARLERPRSGSDQLRRCVRVAGATNQGVASA